MILNTQPLALIILSMPEGWPWVQAGEELAIKSP